VSGAFALTAWVIVTGGLHLDGLMDTADGIFSNQPRERMLEIMKDSRSGAMGVIAAVLILLVKGVLLAALFAAAGRAHFTLLALVPVWSRAFVVLAIAGWPYARSVPGVGSLHRSAGVRHVIGSVLLAALLSVLLLVWAGSFGMSETVALLVLFAVLTYGTGGILAAAASRKLGGLTGDVYGAINEVLELVLLAVVVGMTGH
jgi:cobalamin 5'-phosphate synthase/cobalamin synthase